MPHIQKISRNTFPDSFVICSPSGHHSETLQSKSANIQFAFFQNSNVSQSLVLTGPITSDQHASLHSMLLNQSLIYHSQIINTEKLDDLMLFLPEIPRFDIYLLGKILHPWLKDFSIPTLAACYKVSEKLDDVRKMASIYQGLIQSLINMDSATLDKMISWLDGVDHHLYTLFQLVKKEISGKKKSNKNNRILPSNILGDPHQHADPEYTKENLKEKVRHFFSVQGHLSQLHSGYEPRISQENMAMDVLETLHRDEILIAEAGTGVGKTLAYLVPGIFWLLGRLGERIILATHTKTLQDQVFYKEIPFLQNAIHSPFRAVLLKGRNNYLCKRQWEMLSLQNPENFSQKEKRQLLSLISWVEHTQTGDIEENNAFLAEPSRSLWAKLNAGEGHCQRSLCPYESSCHVQRIRKAARYSDLVVINHSLLFSSLGQLNSVLGDLSTLVIDEAHHIEKSASQYLGVTISHGLVAELIHHLDSKDEASGLIHFLKTGLQKSSLDASLENLLTTEIQQLHQTGANLLQKSSQCFKEFEQMMKPRFKSSRFDSTRLRFTQEDTPFLMVPDSVHALLTAIQQILAGIHSIVRLSSTSGNQQFSKQYEAGINELTGFQEQLHDLTVSIKHFFEHDDDYVYWCEKEYESRESIYYSVPIDLSSLLANKLFSVLKRGILTSATLSIAGNFDYLKYRWGLHFLPDEMIQIQQYESPFSYPDQMKFLLPWYFPSPKESNFTDQTVQLIHAVMEYCYKSTLVLFTSYSMMEDVWQKLEKQKEGSDRILFTQGVHGGRSQLLEKFQENPGAVLLGTSSFWEGVDIPGSALEILIITKLPFDVPNDPVVEARMEDVEKKTGNAFLGYSVPEAIVRFKQGFGRLIRSGSDQGVMILLDNRVISTQYGGLFLKALPVDPVLCDTESSLLKELNFLCE